MTDSHAPLSGSLWNAVVERSRTALACGALHRITTERHIVPDKELNFQVRVVSSLARKHARSAGTAPATQTAKPTNPFLPYEKALWVADVSATHVCLLNKYPVLDHHLLIVTRVFEPQESALTLRDFEALWACLAAYPSLAFYNSGPTAGASQPHKHLQLVPLPLAGSTNDDLPLHTLLASASSADAPSRVERLGFRHAYTRLDPLQLGASTTAHYLHDLYQCLLESAGLQNGGDIPGPYNLLVTRDYMLLVPRTHANYLSIAVNALGYAGSFFLSDATAVETIRAAGPLNILRQVADAQPSG